MRRPRISPRIPVAVGGSIVVFKNQAPSSSACTPGVRGKYRDTITPGLPLVIETVGVHVLRGTLTQGTPNRPRAEARAATGLLLTMTVATSFCHRCGTLRCRYHVVVPGNDVGCFRGDPGRRNDGNYGPVHRGRGVGGTKARVEVAGQGYDKQSNGAVSTSEAPSTECTEYAPKTQHLSGVC